MRRAYLFAWDESGAAHTSLSLQLALRQLARARAGIGPAPENADWIAIGETTVPTLESGFDAYAELDAWGLLAQAWARKMSARGNERTANGREVGQQTVVFRIRYRSTLSILDRIVYDGHAYDIDDVNEIERRKLQDITCTLHSNTQPVS